jgi:hypothetical protein
MVKREFRIIFGDLDASNEPASSHDAVFLIS